MRIKKLGQVLAIAAGLAACMPLGWAADWKVYENKEAGVKIEYPDNWQRSDNEPGALVMFVSPEERRDDPFPEYVGLYVYKPKPAMTPESYNAFSEKEAKQDPNAKVTVSKPATLAGLPAHRMEGVTKKAGQTLQWLQVWTMKDQTVYMCDYVADKESHKNFLKEAERIIASLRIV